MSARARGPRSALWRNPGFLRLWGGQSVSVLGSQVSLIAIPFAAVVLLHVSAFQAGLLGTAEFLPWLLVGLPAGAIVDRLPRRPVLIAAEAGRAAVFASVPAAWWLAHLTIVQLYAVAFVAGVLSVFFDVAYQSYLPELVDTEQLVEGNSKLETTGSAASVAGPAIGGALIAGIGAAVSVLADAVSYVVSVAMLLGIRRGDTPAHDAGAPAWSGWLRGMRRDIAEGLRFLFGHPLLCPIVLCSAAANFFLDMVLALVVLYAVRDMGMSSTAVGLAFSVGSLALLAGAAGAPRIAARLGTGPASALGLRTTFWIAAAGLAPPALLVVFSPVIRLRSIEDAVAGLSARDELSAAPAAPG
jgi:MFS family permease